MDTCDLCNEPAVYHDVRIVEGVHNTVNLCKEHAIEAGIEVQDMDFSVVLQIQPSSTEQPDIKACPDCGMTIPKYKETALLGCSTCYETFKEKLLQVIARVQDNHVQHVGNSPKQITPSMKRTLQIRQLLKELNSAVTRENYENAAKLRDQLKALYESGNTDET